MMYYAHLAYIIRVSTGPSKPWNALLLKVALESLSFGNGALQNEKKTFLSRDNFL